MEFILLGLKGLAVGAANIMPGVSGATLAVIFRVYDRLIESVNSLFTDMKKSLLFLIPFGLGMVIGILALGSLIDFLIQRFSLQSTALIAGLMAGSLPFLHDQAIKNGKNNKMYIITVVAAAIIILLTFVTSAPEPYADTDFNLGFALFLFVGGIVASMAMIIPGVSGAMVLILFGLYPIAMHTITLIREYLATPFDFSLLVPILSIAVPIGLGIVVGILMMSRLISILLEKFHSPTYYAIVGLVFGTIFAMFQDDGAYTSQGGITVPIVIFSVIAFICGLILALRLGKQEGV